MAVLDYRVIREMILNMLIPFFKNEIRIKVFSTEVKIYQNIIVELIDFFLRHNNTFPSQHILSKKLPICTFPV